MQMIDTVILRLKQFDFQITKYDAFTPNCLGFFAHPYTPFNRQSYLKAVQNPSKFDIRSKNYKPRLTVIKRLGRITTDEYDKIVAEFKDEEQDVQEEIKEATGFDNDFLESSLTVLDLSQRASQYFQEASESKKQKILNLVTSNLQQKDGKLVYELRPPFDVLLNLSKTKDWLPTIF